MAKAKNKANSKSHTKKVEGKAGSSKTVGVLVDKPTSFHSSPLNDFLSPFKPAPNQWIAKYIVIIFAIIIRCAIGVGSYSGQGTAPMFGDFEAQRHWLEITQHLPLAKWYFYDLQYWGLDYPPLTAYHSWLLGKIGSVVNRTWFGLDSSRGFESKDLKTFMRLTALVSEAAILFPAVLQYIRHIKVGKSPIDQVVIMGAILFQPCLSLIDHGHFQYNSVMLGFFVASVNCLLQDNLILASFFFVMSITFKQMALYYAPMIFCYILGLCVQTGPFSIHLTRLISVGVTVCLSMVLAVLPFLFQQNRLELLQQILIRVFPFGRGIFEDKVANFWCSTNVVVKYKTLFTNQQLTRLSLLATVLAFTPACTTILLRPRKELLILGFIITSMSFFLFSFQVHEKTILVPLMPTLLLFNRYNPLVSWFSNFALFSLFPLLQKDNLTAQYWTMGVLFNWLVGNLNFISRWLPNFIIPGPTLTKKLNRKSVALALPESWLWRLVIIGSYIAATAIHVVETVSEPPAQYPDLWTIANTTLSFAVFGIFYLWCNYEMIRLAFFSPKDSS